MPTQVTAFPWVPPFAQGFVRDLRVRWALEEAGLPYEVILVDPATKSSADYRRWQPFAQVPAYRDDEVELFESGAIVLHIAAKSEALAPKEPAGRERAMMWVIAALNSVEPQVQNFVTLDAFYGGEAWVEGFRPKAWAMTRERLAALEDWLQAKEWLEDRFTVGDLVMTCVLRELIESGSLKTFPVVEAYVERCLARPAFGRALEAQLETFRRHAPAA
ncbi:MAG TPA: glutathione S-transferase family protein [Caulobacteraceae bacterium]|nr:glutathione S-transferase family protein [Caulobacteraceae bacterium]